MRKYYGMEIDENMDCVGTAYFVVFGEMADGTKCYHKIENGVELEDVWYSRRNKDGWQIFFVEGE